MNSTFHEELEFALQSVPIIYISHFDYNTIDEEIKCCVNKLGLSAQNISEFDLNRGVLNFDDKKIKYDNGKIPFITWLSNIVEANNLEEERVFLIKNIDLSSEDRSTLHRIANSTGGNINQYDIALFLQTFAAKYHHKDYDNLGEVYSIIIVSPTPIAAVAPNIEKILTPIEYPLPDYEQIKSIIASLPIALSAKRRFTEQQFQANLTSTLLGLSLYDIQQIIRILLTKGDGKLDSNAINDALVEKQRIVKKSGIIEVVDPDVTLDDVGGLSVLKEDIHKKAHLYKNLNEIQEKKGFNLPIPKGILIIGMPGCGKTMIAKAIASKFEVSLLRLDVNRLMGQYVGMSEENLRRALQTAETAHPCVLWIDEVEKAFAGAGAGGENDMLVQRLMGQFLTWMQERKTAVYIVATANDVMRPEFMRKGRFDEVYFVDFPNVEERKSILQAKMKRYGLLQHPTDPKYDFSDFVTNGQLNENFDDLAQEMRADKNKETKVDDLFCTGFSGAEIESVVNQVMENIYVRYRQSVENKITIKTPVQVTRKDFAEVIDSMRGSIMANQVSLKEDKQNHPGKMTNIERIRDLQKTYNFKPASR